MRQRIIEADLIECVLGLGPGLFYNSPMEACVLFCRTQKAPTQRGKVRFVDASADYSRQQGQSFLSAEHIARIVQTARTESNAPGYARTVDVTEIASNNFSLNLPLYVRAHRTDVREPQSVPLAIRQFRDSATQLRDADTRLGASLDALR